VKLNVIGVKRISGTAKSGNEFDICNLLAIVPVQAGGGKTVRVEGFGFEVAELPLDQSALHLFSGLKFPSLLDLETDSRPYMGKLETFVTGIISPNIKVA
jgi:hypothetical protein